MLNYFDFYRFSFHHNLYCAKGLGKNIVFEEYCRFAKRTITSLHTRARNVPSEFVKRFATSSRVSTQTSLSRILAP